MTASEQAIDRVRTTAMVDVMRKRGRGGKWLAYWGPPTIVFGIFLGVWYLFSYVVLTPDRRFLLPPPQAVVKVSFLDSENRLDLFRALGLSTSVALLGLAISIVI